MTVKAAKKPTTTFFFFVNDCAVEVLHVFLMSTEERTCLKQMRKIGLKYPVKIQVPIKVTHTASPH